MVKYTGVGMGLSRFGSGVKGGRGWKYRSIKSKITSREQKRGFEERMDRLRTTDR